MFATHPLAKAPYRALTAITAIVAAVLVAVHLPAGVPAQTTTTPMKFGLDATGSLHPLVGDVRPDLGMLWIGPWTLASGWGGPDQRLTALSNAGVTPAVQFYYWGDDISETCLKDGCWSKLHKVQKTQADWERLTVQFGTHLNSTMKGKPVIAILETEFNKGSVAYSELLDERLATRSAALKKAYPSLTIVLGFGNWNSASWSTFNRAAAASDAVGIQGMRGSTRHSASSYDALFADTLTGIDSLKAKFAKPVWITDIALSSYSEPEYLERQAAALSHFTKGLVQLQTAGVQGLMYRTLLDNPTMDTANYFGEAERHWGLAWHANATAKPALQIWKDGVKTIRGAANAPAPTTTTPAQPTTTTAAPTTTTKPPTTTTTKPPTTSTTPTTNRKVALVEAEAIGYTGPGRKESDSTASQGARWNLWSAGTITWTFNTDCAGTHRILLTAKGALVNGQTPMVTVKIDSGHAHEKTLHTSWYTHSTTQTLTKGTHTVRVTFLNDYNGSQGDRNALLDKLELRADCA